jgi:hypothetical protein
MRRFLLTRFIACLALLLSVAAVPRIIGPYPAAFYQNGAWFSANDITAIPSETDANIPFAYQVTDSVNGNVQHSAVLTPRPPTTVYTKTLAGYVYEDGQLTNVKVCKTRDPSLVLLDFPLTYSVDQVDQLQSLVGSNPQGGNNVGHWADLPRLINRGMRRILSIGSFFKDLFGGGGGCGDCVTQEQFNSLSTALTQFKDSAITALNAQSKWDTTASQEIVTLSGRADQLDSITQNLQQQLTASAQQLAAVQGAQQVVNQQVTNQFAATNAALGVTQNAVNNLGNVFQSALTGFNANQVQMFWALNNATISLTQALNNLSSSTNSQIQFIQGQLRAITRELRNVAGLVSQVDLDEVRKDKMVIGINQQIAQQTIAGNVLPFLEKYPDPPASDPSQYADTVIDDLRFFYQQNGGGGTILLNQLDVFLYCDTIQVFQQRKGWMTYIDFLEMLGPQGCAADSSCLCYVYTERSQCVLNQTNGGFANVPKAIDLSDANAPCNGHTVTGSGLDQRYIYNVSALQDLFSARCTAHLAGSYGWMLSRQTGNATLFSYNTSSPNCNIDFSQVMNVPPNWPGPEYLFFRQIPQSFQAADKFVVDRKKAILGGMPLGPTYTWLPYQTINGTDADCLVGSYMAYSPTLLPVYVLSNPQESLGLEVSIDGGPTVTRIDAILSAQNRFGAEDYFVVVGEPDSATWVYNIPQSLLSLAPWAPSRIDQVTYHLFPNTSCTTLSCWLAYYNTFEFDQNGGQAVPEIFKESVDPFTGLCNSTRRVYDGSHCTRRDKYKISCTSSTCSLVARQWEYQVSGIRIPGNAIATVVYSTCPAVSVNFLPSAAVVTLNSVQTYPVTIKAVVTGPCPFEKDDVSVPGPGASTLTIRPCDAIADVPRPLPPWLWSNLTIYQQNGLSWDLCNSSVNINVTVDRDTVIQDTGQVDQKYTHNTAITVQDPVTIGVAQTNGDTNLIIQQLSTSVGGLYHALGLTQTAQFTDVLSPIIAQTAGVISDNYAAFNASRNSLLQNFNITGAASGFYQQFSAAQANQTALAAANAANFQNESVLANLSASLIVGLAQQTAAVVIADEAWKNATIELVQEEQVVTGGLYKGITSDSGGGVFGSIISTIGKVVTGVANFGPVQTLANGAVKLVNGVASAAEDVWSDVKVMLDAIAKAAALTIGALASAVGGILFILPWCLGILFILVLFAMGSRVWAFIKQQNSDGKIIAKGPPQKTYDVAELVELVNKVFETQKQLVTLLANNETLDKDLRASIRAQIETPLLQMKTVEGHPYKVPSVKDMLVGKSKDKKPKATQPGAMQPGQSAEGQPNTGPVSGPTNEQIDFGAKAVMNSSQTPAALKAAAPLIASAMKNNPELVQQGVSIARQLNPNAQMLWDPRDGHIGKGGLGLPAGVPGGAHEVSSEEDEDGISLSDNDEGDPLLSEDEDEDGELPE